MRKHIRHIIPEERKIFLVLKCWTELGEYIFVLNYFCSRSSDFYSLSLSMELQQAFHNWKISFKILQLPYQVVNKFVSTQKAVKREGYNKMPPWKRHDCNIHHKNLEGHIVWKCSSITSNCQKFFWTYFSRPILQQDFSDSLSLVPEEQIGFSHCLCLKRFPLWCKYRLARTHSSVSER